LGKMLRCLPYRPRVLKLHYCPESLRPLTPWCFFTQSLFASSSPSPPISQPSILLTTPTSTSSPISSTLLIDELISKWVKLNAEGLAALKSNKLTLAQNSFWSALRIDPASIKSEAQSSSSLSSSTSFPLTDKPETSYNMDHVDPTNSTLPLVYYALTLANIATVYRKLNMNGGAKKAYIKSLHFFATVDSNKPIDPSILANLHRDLGLVYESEGDLDNAQESFEKAPHYYKKLTPPFFHCAFDVNSVPPNSIPVTPGTSDQNVKEGILQAVSQCLFSLASVEHHRGQHQLAVKKYTHAILISKQVFGEKHRNVGYALCSLAQLQKQMKDYQTAEKTYLEGLTILGDSKDPAAMQRLDEYIDLLHLNIEKKKEKSTSARKPPKKRNLPEKL